MKKTNFQAACLAGTLVILFLIGWESYLRNRGFTLSYNDDESLWAHTRQQIYDATPAGPVIVGTSRAKFDIDLQTWEGITGQSPVQLGIVGTTPRPVLQDLADDPAFKGTVIVDVMEPLFFQPDGSFAETSAKKRLDYYPKWSLSQQAGFFINQPLENHLMFLDEERYSVNALIKRLPIASRPGVFVFPVFPMEFEYVQPNRQTSFTENFLKDTTAQREVRDVWTRMGLTSAKRGVSGDTLAHIIRSVAQAVGKIRARGGEVLLVRFPSSDAVWNAEQQAYPRALYWERLVKETGVAGIHFADYPELSRYKCPEWSHLTPADARAFTKDLARIIETKTKWSLQNAVSHHNP
ncbi:hypothetical protein GCM10010967_31470 [Dyadobacter beijingensis]|uniref:SGNH/GDSL hydrolase family protein n=1 Tax=Dyadobacter beijingensis TaxID=365489 RepID=A0ABQ2I0Y8_9BACT|nr:hypothetical protein [Dyadobacter beijingensis]GGM95681.1 hypothetical protein GCM10010967_31470 [Dyadobacter beijingensis]